MAQIISLSMWYHFLLPLPQYHSDLHREAVKHRQHNLSVQRSMAHTQILLTNHKSRKNTSMKETEKIKVNGKSKDNKNNEEHRKWIR